MIDKNQATTDYADRELVITRTLNAPRTLVFEAWTQPEHLINWWGPAGFTNTFHAIEVKPGGTWRFTMHGPDGVDYENVILFKEVVKPERIVYEHGSDKEDDPEKFHVTVTFEAQSAKTILTMRTLFASKEVLEKMIKAVGAVEGAKQTIDRLEQHLSDMEPVVIERVFQAPPDKIWRALTDKNEMKKWYFDLQEFKPEKGFEFQFLGGPDKEHQYNHLCKITEVIEGKKIAYSWRFDGYPGNSEVSFELFPEGDQTRLRVTHDGLATFPATNKDFAKENFAQGWTGIMDKALAKYLMSDE